MITTERYDRLHRLFETACELEAQQRCELLDRECADDPTMRREVEALLARDHDPSTFLMKPALGEDFGLANADRIASGAADLVPGHRIDNYIIREKLGEGGVAVVYLAQQDKPVRRRVAVKVIKPGMDSKQVIARFEAERQALAMMDHACIAKVFDAGATDSGRPYFVMEYVPGIPITEHCDRQHLDIPQRLDLFMQVCDAVQHAHQKGIIHRDLKPSNVLVLIKDGQAVPKIIDFGVAKALHQRLTERTIFTEQGQFIGTPAYMSPEQAELTAQDIDTRSDIYALGVLLYELLTGAPPFDPQKLRAAAFGEIQRIIREEEPPKPSTRLSSVGDESTNRAHERHADPRPPARELRGDLDWIVMKALEKERARRYETARGLALDIRRHLDHEPVHAGPPSRAYRLRKFVRRHRAGVATGAVVAISLLVAAVVSASFALSESQQRRAAATERDTARAINEFLNDDLLAAVAPSAEAGKGRDVLMRDVLDEAAKSIEETSAAGGRFEDKPLVEASIRETLGLTYKALGELRAAELHLERARELRRHVLGEEHPETLSSMNRLALLYCDLARHAEAASLHEETLEARRRILGAEDPATLESMHNVARVYALCLPNRETEGEALFLETLESRRRVLGSDHRATMKTLFELAVLYHKTGREVEAEAAYREVLQTQRHVLGTEHPDTLFTMADFARFYNNLQRYQEGTPLYLEVLEIQRRVLGEEHPDTLRTINNLGWSYRRMGQPDKAEPLHAEAAELALRVWGHAHPNAEATIANLARLYRESGRHEKWLALWRGVVDECRGQLPHGHVAIGMYLTWLGLAHVEQQEYGEAEPLAREAVGILRREVPEGSRRYLGSALSVLGASLAGQMEYEQAEPLLVEAYDELKGWSYNPDEQFYKLTLANLVGLYDARGEPDKLAEWQAKPAEELLQMAARPGATAADLKSAFQRMHQLALEYWRQGRYAEAEPLYLEALEISKRVLGPEHPKTLFTMDNLSFMYRDQGLYDEAEPLNRKALETMQRVLGKAHAATLMSMENLAYLCQLQGRYDEAEALYRAALEIRSEVADQPGASDGFLNSYAWMLLTAEPEELRDPGKALEMALRANELSGYQDPAQLDTLALAYHRTGDLVKAIEIEQKALDLLPADAPDRHEYEAQLAEFQRALDQVTRVSDGDRRAEGRE